MNKTVTERTAEATLVKEVFDGVFAYSKERGRLRFSRGEWHM